MRLRSRKSYLKNRERVLERTHARYRGNPQVVLRQCSEWRKNHLDQARETARKWAAENRDERRKCCRDWYHRNLESQRERSRKKALRERIQNPEKIRARNLRWSRNNPARVIQNHSKRMALLKKSARNVKLISAWMVSTRKKTGIHCYYCETPIHGKAIRFDHIVPVAKGGPHAIENLCCSCHPCNSSKHAKRVSDWLTSGQLIFDL